MDQVKIPKEVNDHMTCIWIYKMITFFRLGDTQGTGRLSKEQFAQQVLTRVQESEDERKNKLPTQIFIDKLWTLFFADAEDGDDVSLQSFLLQRYTAVTENQPQQTAAISATAMTVSKTYGTQPDGDMTFEDCAFPLRVFFGLSQYNYKLSFAALDTDCDGLIQAQELVSGFLNFFLSDTCDNGISAFGLLTPVKLL